MPDLQRLTLVRRALALGSRPPLSTLSRLKRTFSAPPSTVIDSRDVLIVNALRPQGSAFVLSAVRTLLCNSVPLGIASAATGSYLKGRFGVVMKAILSGAPRAVHVQFSEIRT